MGLNGTKVQDKAWIAVDPVTNNLYVTWTQFDQYGSNNPADSSVIMFSRSTDGGATWSTAKRINKTAGDCIDSDNTVEGAVPAVGPNGEVYVAWAGPDGLIFDRSTDTGNSWLDNDISVSTISGGWDYSIPGISRANGLPITACDLSNGPYHGNIYINWSDQRNGINNTDVWLVKSTDGGNTWSAPARVNDDTTQNHQFFTWMTIDKKPVICILFFTTDATIPVIIPMFTLPFQKTADRLSKTLRFQSYRFCPIPRFSLATTQIFPLITALSAPSGHGCTTIPCRFGLP
jgi:hypothetical protein